MTPYSYRLTVAAMRPNARFRQILLQKYFGARPSEVGQKMIPARLG
jgi:hypothetical protein